VTKHLPNGTKVQVIGTHRQEDKRYLNRTGYITNNSGFITDYVVEFAAGEFIGVLKEEIVVVQLAMEEPSPPTQKLSWAPSISPTRPVSTYLVHAHGVANLCTPGAQTRKPTGKYGEERELCWVIVHNSAIIWADEVDWAMAVSDIEELRR
jgi:hypothetical protein